MLNGRRVDIPSIRLKAGDVLTVRPHSLQTDYFKNLDDVSPAPVMMSQVGLKLTVRNLRSTSLACQLGKMLNQILMNN